MFNKAETVKVLYLEYEAAIKQAAENLAGNFDALEIAVPWIEVIEPLLPPKWKIGFENWRSIRVGNYAETEVVDTVQFQSVIRTVEAALGVELKVEALFTGSGLLSSLSASAWTPTKSGQRYGLYVSVRFFHGNCKIEFEEKTIRVPKIEDACLRLGTEKPKGELGSDPAHF